MASQKLEAKQVAEIREKIAELEDNGTELKDYTWLSQVCATQDCLAERDTARSVLHSLSKRTALQAPASETDYLCQTWQRIDSHACKVLDGLFRNRKLPNDLAGRTGPHGVKAPTEKAYINLYIHDIR